MKKIVNTTFLCRNNDQIFSEIDGEVIMLNIPNAEYYNLNSIASLIWKHFDQPKSLDSLLYVLQSKFQVSKDVCEQDTKEFVADLFEKGLLIIVDETN